jgi:hypothetical protein
MKKSSMTRRSLLRALGISAAAIPFLPILEREAAAEGFPKRLIIFYFPNGTSLPSWRCAGGETDFALSPALAPLERHRDQIVILDGIDAEVSANNPHLVGHPGLVGFFTGTEPLAGDFTTCTGSYGWAGGPSVDQVVADAYAASTPIRSLSIGTMLQQNDYALPYSRLSYRGANEPVTPLEDPAEIFDYLFGSFTLDPEKAAKIRAGRQSVIDSMAADLVSLENQLRGDDLAKVGAHLDNLQALEKRIQNTLGAACVLPERPTSALCAYNASVDCNDAIMPPIFDLITAALTCDVTRVVAYQGATESNGPRMPHHVEIPHELSHRSDAEGFALQTEITAWWMEHLAQLLDRLRAVPEGGGTLLDNTLVVAASCAGESWIHGERNVPIVLAGGAGGYVNRGRYHRFGSYPADSSYNREAHGGRTMNDVLISICRAMDLDVSTFGNPAYCTGPIEEIT